MVELLLSRGADITIKVVNIICYSEHGSNAVNRSGPR